MPLSVIVPENYEEKRKQVPHATIILDFPSPFFQDQRVFHKSFMRGIEASSERRSSSSHSPGTGG